MVLTLHSCRLRLNPPPDRLKTKQCHGFEVSVVLGTMDLVTAPQGFSATTHPTRIGPAILVGGLVAGTFDQISAFISFGWGVPRAIASGLLGSKAFQGGTATWLLGIGLHFFIALSAAAIYVLSSRRLDFLRQHFFVCGLFFGIAVYLVMNLVVLPLSAVPFKVGPFSVHAMIQGLLVHMFLIGLPISVSTRVFSK